MTGGTGGPAQRNPEEERQGAMPDATATTATKLRHRDLWPPHTSHSLTLLPVMRDARELCVMLSDNERASPRVCLACPHDCLTCSHGRIASMGARIIS